MASLTPNPNTRGYLLPDGCKDLIDVLNGQPGESPALKQDSFRVNQEIQAEKVRVIDEHGKLIGILDLAAALALARSKNFDLIQLTLPANPPICRIVDWGKSLQVIS